ncbi:trypsin-like serine protease [Actinoplanes sp. TBRC 11911]|nr:trypsin-like serine protease [Actinoplanes sp. TBRC 11911]
MILLVPLTLLLTPGKAQAIAHGEDVRDGDYRFSVRLTMTGIATEDGGTRDSWCTGALIASRWVITAGHCFRDNDDRRVSHTVAKRTIATIGRPDLKSQGGHDVAIVGVHQSPTADVALAELETPVTDIPPLRIGTTAPTVGEIVRLTGYGLVADAGTKGPTRLQTGQFAVTMVSDSLIGVAGHSPRKDTSACLHDSGGPYFHEEPDGQLALVAVVSTGPSCPHEGDDFSARTDNLHDWINDTINPGFPVRRYAVIVASLLVVAGAAVITRWGLAGRRSPRP